MIYLNLKVATESEEATVRFESIVRPSLFHVARKLRRSTLQKISPHIQLQTGLQSSSLILNVHLCQFIS